MSAFYRFSEVVDDKGNDYRMYYEVDRDEHGPYPYMLRFRYEGFPWEPSMVPQRVQDRLIAAAYEQIRGPSE